MDHQDWYKPGKSIQQFHASKARTRVLVGARGSGKTTAWVVEMLGHLWHNPGGKAYVLRKTEKSNQESSQETFELCLQQCGSAYVDTGTSLFKKIEGGRFYRIPSAKAVELYNLFLATGPNKTHILQWLETVGSRYCSHVHFSGVPDPTKRDTRFRGYECSMLVFVEADQLLKEDLDMASFCLRWKGADGQFIQDTCCVLDTNPPGTKHWIAMMELEADPGDDIEFWHIPMEENAHNLPPNYVEDARRLYKDNPPMFKRMILGEYADAFEGARVFWAFSESHAYEDLPWPRGAYLIRSWDFGTDQAIVWSAYWNEGSTEYWWDMHEYLATQSDCEKQCRQAWAITNEVFPFWNDRTVCSGIKDFCDPAGNAKTDKGRSVDVLRTHKIFPGWSNRHRSLQLTLAAYNRLLETKDRKGRRVYRIDKKSCPVLYSASLGGYRYPNVGEPGYGNGEPGKGPTFGSFDHVSDASRYGKINCLRLMTIAMEDVQKPVGALARTYAPNPAKRYR